MIELFPVYSNSKAYKTTKTLNYVQKVHSVNHPFLSMQILIVLSSHGPIKKTITWKCLPGIVRTQFPLAIFQILTVASLDPDAIRDASLRNSRHVTSALCPIRVAEATKDPKDQICNKIGTNNFLGKNHLKSLQWTSANWTPDNRKHSKSGHICARLLNGTDIRLPILLVIGWLLSWTII
jgi:hypothetical protein